MQTGDGLKPSSAGKRVRFTGDGGPKTVIDGPFAETKELIAGFWIWKVKDLNEALAWVKKCPDPMPGEESEDRNPPLLRGGRLRRRITRPNCARGKTRCARISNSNRSTDGRSL